MTKLHRKGSLFEDLFRSQLIQGHSGRRIVSRKSAQLAGTELEINNVHVPVLTPWFTTFYDIWWSRFESEHNYTLFYIRCHFPGAVRNGLNI